VVAELARTPGPQRIEALAVLAQMDIGDPEVTACSATRSPRAVPRRSWGS